MPAHVCRFSSGSCCTILSLSERPVTSLVQDSVYQRVVAIFGGPWRAERVLFGAECAVLMQGVILSWSKHKSRWRAPLPESDFFILDKVRLVNWTRVPPCGTNLSTILARPDCVRVFSVMAAPVMGSCRSELCEGVRGLVRLQQGSNNSAVMCVKMVPY